MSAPGLWKLAPAVVTKPWGLVHQEALSATGIEVGLGEFWLASAQTGVGNYSNAVVDPPLRRTLAELLSKAAARGDAALEALIGRRAALESVCYQTHDLVAAMVRDSATNPSTLRVDGGMSARMIYHGDEGWQLD